MPSLDIDIDINNIGAATPSRIPASRPRYNTDVMTRLIDPTAMVVPPGNAAIPRYPLFHENWDADLRSYMYLDEFVRARPTWLVDFQVVARNHGTPAQEMTQAHLNDEVLQMIDLALERQNRFFEVIDQDDANGAIGYWLGMLKIDPARHPATNLMVRVGRRIGEHVVMGLKGTFRSPRPSQLSPAIVPMIDPPATPSFPAGHAVQSYLISYLLAYSMPRLPQHQLPDPGFENASGVLFDLAARVSENRIVAGVHYPTDIEAGRWVAIECFKVLKQIGSVWTNADSLRAGVAAEFAQYA
jgi:hypothetical protein